MGSHNPIDTNLIRRAKDGDGPAIEALCHQLLPYVRRVTSSFTGAIDADDATQETMIKVLTGLPGLARENQIVPWCNRIARNTCLSLLRTRKPCVDVEPDSLCASKSASAGFDEDRAIRSVLFAIGGLPTKLRETARLAYLLGLRQQKIADRLRIAEGTVKSRLSTSRKLIRSEVESMFEKGSENSKFPEIDVRYSRTPVQQFELRGYGMFFGSVLEAGDVEQVAFYDYPGPVLTMATVSEVIRTVELLGHEAYEVMVRTIESEPEYPTVIDYFEIGEREIAWLMRTTVRGDVPHLEVDDGSGRWPAMPRFLTSHDGGEKLVVRSCDLTMDSRSESGCVSLLDLGNAEAPAEYVFRKDGRELLHRRYTNRAHAEKRSLPWGMLPAPSKVFGRDGYRRWYDSVLVNR